VNESGLSVRLEAVSGEHANIDGYRSELSKSTSACVSGSPNRALNSTTLGPVGVSITYRSHASHEGVRPREYQDILEASV
jgi:hypothetical protein